MQFTAAQLKSIEDSFGFPTKVHVIYHNQWEVRSHRPGDKIYYDQPGNHMIVRLEVMVNHEMITHSVSVQPWTSEDFEYIARDLVMKTQSYIFSKQFSKASGRI